MYFYNCCCYRFFFTNSSKVVIAIVIAVKKKKVHIAYSIAIDLNYYSCPPSCPLSLLSLRLLRWFYKFGRWMQCEWFLLKVVKHSLRAALFFLDVFFFFFWKDFTTVFSKLLTGDHNTVKHWTLLLSASFISFIAYCYILLYYSWNLMCLFLIVTFFLVVSSVRCPFFDSDQLESG